LSVNLPKHNHSRTPYHPDTALPLTRRRREPRDHLPTPHAIHLHTRLVYCHRHLISTFVLYNSIDAVVQSDLGLLAPPRPPCKAITLSAEPPLGRPERSGRFPQHRSHFRENQWAPNPRSRWPWTATASATARSRSVRAGPSTITTRSRSSRRRSLRSHNILPLSAHLEDGRKQANVRPPHTTRYLHPECKAHAAPHTLGEHRSSAQSHTEGALTIPGIAVRWFRRGRRCAAARACGRGGAADARYRCAHHPRPTADHIPAPREVWL
jgi:hypothetical protein